MKIAVHLAILILITSCGGLKKEDIYIDNEDIYTESDWYGYDESDNLYVSRPVYHGAETILTDLIHTRLEVSFDWKQSRLYGIEMLTAKPHFYPSDSLILDAKGMDINYVSIGSRKLDFTYADDILKIKLDKVYTRDESYTVMIDYVAKPEERESIGSAAILDAKGLYFINPTGEENDKMTQVWTQGETESSSVWFPTIDAPNVKTTQEIFIKVDNKYATLSNGKLLDSKMQPDGMRIDHWKQDQPHAPYLFMMAVGEFKIIEDSYTRKDGSQMDVFYYVEPEWESSAKAIFGETPEMIKFFSERLGVEYAWDKYHQIVVRDYVSGAMENTGAVIFGDFVYKNERELLDGHEESIIAHELFHHWFGDLVTCESWSNLPLNESFANYSQYLWDEYRHGVDEADYNADIEADGYYQSASFQGHHDLIWYDYDDKEAMFDGHSYNKGGRVLHMLRNYLGDDAFFAGLNRYLTVNRFKAAEIHQLRLAFEEVCGEDLNWFFNQWFFASGHPVIQFEQELDSTTNRLKVTVSQKQDVMLTPVYKLPFQIAVFDSNGKHIHPVVVDEMKQEFYFDIQGELKAVIYDYQQMLLARKSEEKPLDQYIYQYYNGERYLTRLNGLTEGAKSKNEASRQMILDALKDPFWDIRLVALSKIQFLDEARKKEAVGVLEYLAVNDPSSSVRNAALNHLSKWKTESERAVIYKDRIMKDSSYTVVSGALKNLATIDPDAAMKLASGLEKENSSKMQAGVAQLYATHGGSDKYDFIVSALRGNTVQGFDKLGVLNSFSLYIVRQEPELIDSACAVYTDQMKNGGFYMGMVLPHNITYILSEIGNRIAALNVELETYDSNNDAALADKVRRKIRAYQSAEVKYNELMRALEDNGEDMMIHDGE